MSNRSVFVLPTGQVLSVKKEGALRMPDGTALTASHKTETKSAKQRRSEFEKMRKKVQETLRRNKEIANAHNR